MYKTLMFKKLIWKWEYILNGVRNFEMIIAVVTCVRHIIISERKPWKKHVGTLY